jgi:mono/diheme cytochrome c family protein
MKTCNSAAQGSHAPHTRSLPRRWVIIPALIAGTFAGGPLSAQTGDTAKTVVPRTTMSGVYTVEQAARGADTYGSVCLSCHTLAEVTGVGFTKKWVGTPLWDLYDYISVNMPQSDPGILTAKEYTQVVAYLLKLNSMPAGKEELVSDTLALKAIKVDTLPVDTVKKVDTLMLGSAVLRKRILRDR